MLTVVSARGKKDKYAGPLLMGAMMVAGTLLPIKLGALAMMSGKALMTSMLALMLSAILALKKLASGGGGGGHSGTTYEVIAQRTRAARTFAGPQPGLRTAGGRDRGRGHRHAVRDTADPAVTATGLRPVRKNRPLIIY
jgi:hypothetical protein